MNDQEPFGLALGAVSMVPALANRTVKLVRRIVKRADQAKSNYNDCKYLAHAVGSVSHALLYISDHTPGTEPLQRALYDLNNVLSVCLKFLEKFSTLNGIENFIYARRYQRQISELYAALDENKSRVLFGMVAGIFTRMR